MGLPPVVVGLVVYFLLSRAGPLGTLGLLFTPTAMIFAQTLLLFPFVAALTRQITADAWEPWRESFRSMGCGRALATWTILQECALALSTVALAAFSRAIGEVGAVMMVGGNIDHATRVMTTAITLETSRGNLALAMALGMILLALTLLSSLALALLRERNQPQNTP